jgi:glycosyltransferase involved in cell wall biosynthesis
VASALPALFSASPGPRVALFHDAIALQYPEFTPRSTVARFPAYLRELLAFDGVAAVSASSLNALTGYWDWLGAVRTPRTVALTLGLDPAPSNLGVAPCGTPTVLCVGSIEARKNHLALLEACEALWSTGSRFDLRLIGMAHAETGAPALRRIESLRRAGRPVDYSGPATDDALERAYAQCAFTVYPSLVEGYGLPVAESLARGRPCICREAGATGEIARGGGCLGLAAADAPEIADAIRSLLQSPERLGALAQAAQRRRFKSWAQYASELLSWMASFGPRG